MKLTILATALSLIAAPATAGDLTITLTDVQASSGPVYVSLQHEQDYMQPRGSYGQVVANPVDGTMTIVLRDVAPGDYALSVWHDLNNDHLFDRDASGRPIDGWASSFTGDIASLRAAPTFAQARFAVAAGATTLSARMIYPARSGR